MFWIHSFLSCRIQPVKCINYLNTVDSLHLSEIFSYLNFKTSQIFDTFKVLKQSNKIQTKRITFYERFCGGKWSVRLQLIVFMTQEGGGENIHSRRGLVYYSAYRETSKRTFSAKPRRPTY